MVDQCCSAACLVRHPHIPWGQPSPRLAVSPIGHTPLISLFVFPQALCQSTTRLDAVQAIAVQRQPLSLCTVNPIHPALLREGRTPYTTTFPPPSHKHATPHTPHELHAPCFQQQRSPCILTTCVVFLWYISFTKRCSCSHKRWTPTPLPNPSVLHVAPTADTPSHQIKNSTLREMWLLRSYMFVHNSSHRPPRWTKQHVLTAVQSKLYDAAHSQVEGVHAAHQALEP